MEKEAQLLFKQYIKRDFIIQLKSGKILFLNSSDIYTHNEKTFQKIFEIKLHEILIKYYKEKNISIEEEDNIIGQNEILIKELNDGLIIIACNKYLIELSLKEKSYYCKVIMELEDTILNINELPDKRIIIINNNEIIIIEREDEKYIIKEKLPIKYEWKMQKNHIAIMIYLINIFLVK